MPLASGRAFGCRTPSALGAAPTHPSPCTEGPFKRSPEDVVTHAGEVTGDRGEEQEHPCWECREMAVLWP